MPIDSDTVPCGFMLLRTTTTINNNNRQQRQEQRGETKTGERRNENFKNNYDWRNGRQKDSISTNRQNIRLI